MSPAPGLVRIGIIGAGAMAEYHVKKFSAIAGALMASCRVPAMSARMAAYASGTSQASKAQPSRRRKKKEVAEQLASGAELRTVVQITIRPKRQRDRRRNGADECARHLFVSLKSYLMAQDYAEPRR